MLLLFLTLNAQHPQTLDCVCKVLLWKLYDTTTWTWEICKKWGCIWEGNGTCLLTYFGGGGAAVCFFLFLPLLYENIHWIYYIIIVYFIILSLYYSISISYDLMISYMYIYMCEYTVYIPVYTCIKQVLKQTEKDKSRERTVSKKKKKNLF